ncbi:MAG: oligosaccharide flippase family protein [Pseudomonadota bacterium]|nr:oligosaccharide flippase family protein [Pseudomonadota bacterium]
MSSGAIWRARSSYILAAFERLIGSRASFTGHLAINLTGSVLARLITLASMVAITRLYAATDYGQWVVVLSLASFIVPLATMRYDIGVVIAPTRHMAAALVLAIAAGALATAFVSAAIALIAPPSVVRMVSGLTEGQQKLILLVPLVLLLLTTQTVLQAWMTRERKFAAMSLSQMLQALVTAAVTILLPFVAGASAGAAATGAIVGLVCGLFVCVWASSRNLIALIGSNPAAAAVDAMRHFKVYPLYMLPYSLSIGILERVTQLILASAYSTGALGTFYVARQITMGAANIVCAALGQVMFAHSAREERCLEIKSRTDRLLTFLIDAEAPALAFCLVWLPSILNLLMGSRWTGLSDFAWWNLFPASTLFLVGWLHRILDVLGRQRLAVGLQAASDAFLVLVAAVCPLAGLDATGFVAALSIAISLFDIIWLAIVLRLLQFAPSEIMRLAARAVVLLVFWSAAQGAVRVALSAQLGPFLGALLLALALALLARKRGVYLEDN